MFALNSCLVMHPGPSQSIMVRKHWGKTGEEGGFVKSLGCGAGFAYFLPLQIVTCILQKEATCLEREKNYGRK